MESKMMEHEMAKRQVMMEAQWRHEMEAQMARDWRSDFIQNEVLESRKKELNAAFEQAQTEEQRKDAEGQHATGELINMMMNDPDPKFQNSKFLDFLKRVKTGEVELKEDNTMVLHPEKAGASLNLVLCV